MLRWASRCPPQKALLKCAVARQLKGHFSTGKLSQRRLRSLQCIQPSSQPGVTTPAQGLHVQHVRLQDCLRPAAQTAVISVRSISAQIARNHLREAHLHARRPHRGLDRSTVYWRSWREWASAHIRWRLALWRDVLVTDESRFSLYGADGSAYGVMRVCGLLMSASWIERPKVVLCREGCLMDNEHGCVFIDRFFNAHREQVLRPTVVPFIHGHHLRVQHDSARPPIATIFSWKLKTSKFFYTSFL